MSVSRLQKFVTVLRNNPKKSIAFASVVAYGCKWANNKYRENELLTQFCIEAAKFGEERFPLAADHRRITVILNPAADGGKCRARFEKYCAPLLYLAGLKVAVVRTEHEGQAKELLALLEKTDGLVVAGGDGTASEVLTGLLRREDNLASRLPLCLLPLGQTSSAVKSVLRGGPGQAAATPEELMTATMAVLHKLYRPMGVMEITPQAGEEEGPIKPIYACGWFDWGAYRDAWERRDKYWYWPGLKKYMTYVFSSYKDLSWDCAGSLELTMPCSGCSNCRAKPVTAARPVVKPANRKWYHSLIGDSKWQQNQGGEKQTLLDQHRDNQDRSSIENETCGLTHTSSLEGVCDVRVGCANVMPELGQHQIALQTGIQDTSATDFIREGWQRNKSGEPCNDKEMILGSVTIKPGDSTLTTQKDGEEKPRNFYIDGQIFDVRAIKIRPVPDAVLLFAPPLPTA